MYKGMRVKTTVSIKSGQLIIPAGTIGFIEEADKRFGGPWSISVNFEGYGEVYTKEGQTEAYPYDVLNNDNADDWVKKGTSDLMAQLGW